MSHPIKNNKKKRKSPSYFYSILSVALVLFLLGFFGLFLMHAPKWIKVYKENVSLMVEVKENVSAEDIQNLTNSLQLLPYIKGETVEYVSKETIAEEMKEELGSSDNTLGITNPFYDMITFNLKADYLHNDSLSNIRQEIVQNEIVKDVFYQELLVDEINANLKRIGWSALVVGLFFILIAAVLIHNTIRLAMYSNRFLIKNMQLVGATWDFISQPYLKKGITNGLWSGFLAIVLLLSVVFLMQFQFPCLRFDIWLDDILSIVLVTGGIILLGVFITYSSTYFVVNKYLKMRLDDLY